MLPSYQTISTLKLFVNIMWEKRMTQEWDVDDYRTRSDELITDKNVTHAMLFIFLTKFKVPLKRLQCLYSLSDVMPYHQISRNLEATRFNFSDRSVIWQSSRHRCCRDACQFQSDTMILTHNLATGKLCEISRIAREWARCRSGREQNNLR